MNEAMDLMASDAEKEIRDTLVDWLGQHRPNNRTVHELNTAGTGSLRVDVASIGEHELLLFEIKSRKDKLDRLKNQVPAFVCRSHRTIVVADQKWFSVKDEYGYSRLVPHDDLQPKNALIWIYPYDPDDKRNFHFKWELKAWRRGYVEPHAHRVLEMLWREELKQECDLFRVSVGSRATRRQMIQELVLKLNGAEIRKAVCRQLRSRPWLKGDETIIAPELKPMTAA